MKYWYCFILINILNLANNYVSSQNLIKQEPVLDSGLNTNNSIKIQPIIGRIEQILQSSHNLNLYSLEPRADKNIWLRQRLNSYPAFFSGKWAGELKLTSLYSPQTPNLQKLSNLSPSISQFFADNLVTGTKVNVNFDFAYNKTHLLHLKPPLMFMRLSIFDYRQAPANLSNAKFVDIKETLNTINSLNLTEFSVDKKLIRNYILQLRSRQIEQDLLVLVQDGKLNSLNQPGAYYSETIYQFDIESNNVIDVIIVVLKYSMDKVCTSKTIYQGKLYRGYTANFNGCSNVSLYHKKINNQDNSELEPNAQAPNINSNLLKEPSDNDDE